MASLSLSYTPGQIASEDFGVAPMSCAIYDTIVFGSGQNDPMKVIELFEQMQDTLPAVLEQTRADKAQALMFKKQMLATSIAALAYIELSLSSERISPEERQICMQARPGFVNMFGRACVELGAVPRPKNNKLNVAGLQKDIFNPIASRLIDYLMNRR